MPGQRGEQLLSQLNALHPQHGHALSIFAGPVRAALQDGTLLRVVSTPGFAARKVQSV
jgi:hypothetical protein